jgi:hypothetical protein
VLLENHSCGVREKKKKLGERAPAQEKLLAARGYRPDGLFDEAEAF